MIVVMKTSALFICGWLLAASLGATAAPCQPRFEAGWIRLPAQSAMPMAAGFGRFVNRCAAPAEVVSVVSPVFGDVSMHQTTQADGVSRMREVSTLTLPADGAVELRPGGLHLMLMQPAQPLRAGQRLPLTFRLRDGAQIYAELEVRPNP